MNLDNWNSALYDQKHSFVYEYGRELLALLSPQPGERLLDIGCGTGHLTKQIAETGALVTGIDSSIQMIEAARQHYPDIEFIHGDAADFSVAEPCDAIFSNATLHWVAKAEEAVRCMSQALRHGGRLVLEFGGKGNVANILAAMQQAGCELGHAEFASPWYYPTIGEYAALLECHHFTVEAAWLFDRPVKLEGEDGMLNWLRMFGTVKASALGDEERERLFTLAVEKARDTQYLDGQWYADYRRIRVVARKD